MIWSAASAGDDSRAISSLLSLQNMIDFWRIPHAGKSGCYGYVTAATALYAFYNAVLVWSRIAFMLLERWRSRS